MGYSVWKAILQPLDLQDIDVPEDSELLTAREQHDQICVWFKCDPSKPTSKRHIAVCGTGHPAPEGGRYIGTCLLHSGSLVVHVFERGLVP